jgi:hypothetical protein
MSVLSLVPVTRKRGTPAVSDTRHASRAAGWPRALDVELAVQHVGAEVGERLVNHVLACRGASARRRPQESHTGSDAPSVRLAGPRVLVFSGSSARPQACCSPSEGMLLWYTCSGATRRVGHVLHRMRAGSRVGSAAGVRAPWRLRPRRPASGAREEVDCRATPPREASLRRGAVRRSADAAAGQGTGCKGLDRRRESRKCLVEGGKVLSWLPSTAAPSDGEAASSSGGASRAWTAVAV